jgi:hypothetical protein
MSRGRLRVPARGPGGRRFLRLGAFLLWEGCRQRVLNPVASSPDYDLRRMVEEPVEDRGRATFLL